MLYASRSPCRLRSARHGVSSRAAAKPTGPAAAGDVVCTLGGVVELILVTLGQQVNAGDRVVIIEAMKMKTPMVAQTSGKVEAILVKVGEGVETGQVLLKLA